MDQTLTTLGAVPSRDFRTASEDPLSAAKYVAGLDSLRYEAPSAYHAASWLLALRQSHCSDHLDPQMRPSIDSQYLLGFRGQHARYDMLVPSICRISEDTRRLSQHAGLWFRAAIQSFHDRSYRYREPRYGCGRYWFGVDEMIPVAEHYGICTNLMNWSWDPLVAVVFAIKGLCEGESGMVLVRPVDPSHDAEFVLAPSIARRVWLQRGFFQELACPNEMSLPARIMPLLMRSSPVRLVSQLVHIRFPCTAADIEWAEAMFHRLLLASDPILPLAEWSMELAAAGPPHSAVLHHAGDWEYLQEELEKRSLRTPPFGEMEHEDVGMMIDYIDSVALRSRAGVLGYDLRTLAYISKRLPIDATIRNPDYAKRSGSGRLQTLTRFLEMNTGYLKVLSDQIPFSPVEDNLRGTG